MIAFDEITAFRLFRRLAIGQGTYSMYLLICPDETRRIIEDDLRAEAEVQLGAPLPLTDINALLEDPKTGASCAGRAVCGYYINQLTSDVVALLDTHVVRLERSGSQLLFVAAPEIAERLLAEAPNFRNRLTEILRVMPDQSIGGRTI